jgi:hypothetical protein
MSGEIQKYPNMCRIIKYIVDESGGLYERDLGRLLFISDLQYNEEVGHQYLEGIYVRCNYGVINRLVGACLHCMDGIEVIVTMINGDLKIIPGTVFSGGRLALYRVDIDDKFLNIVRNCMMKFGFLIGQHDALEDYLYDLECIKNSDFGEAMIKVPKKKESKMKVVINEAKMCTLSNVSKEDVQIFELGDHLYLKGPPTESGDDNYWCILLDGVKFQPWQRIPSDSMVRVLGDDEAVLTVKR